jgi:D-lactate dehydrogenase (cytochrome)
MNTITPPSESARAGAVSAVLAKLSPVFGDRVSSNASIREQHGRGEGLRDVALPDLVAFALSTEEVSLAVKACAEHRLPIIPFGVGTSLEGHVSAPFGGLTLDMSRMNRILSVSAEDLDCRVEAGVTRIDLNAYIRDQGLFFPLDPGANATLGGMASTRASGTNAVRYGTMREVTLGLTVVTPAGEIITTGGRARKSSAGYDLTRLYIGSEGTLGVITEIQLRLFGVPEKIAAATCQFPDTASAVSAVITALQIGIPVARIELADALTMQAVCAYSKLTDFEALPTLFLEFHGGPASVAEQIAQMRDIVDEAGGSTFRFAELEEERSRLWKARHDTYYAGMASRPGCEGYVTDACVPISALAATIAECEALVSGSGLTGSVVGHVGDGNFHMMLLFDPTRPEQRQHAEDLALQISGIAQRFGGTCTGEHGIGVHKLEALKREHGAGVDVMRAIKQALDPLGIMNPGKTIPQN